MSIWLASSTLVRRYRRIRLGERQTWAGITAAGSPTRFEGLSLTPRGGGIFRPGDELNTMTREAAHERQFLGLLGPACRYRDSAARLAGCMAGRTAPDRPGGGAALSGFGGGPDRGGRNPRSLLLNCMGSPDGPRSPGGEGDYLINPVAD